MSVHTTYTRTSIKNRNRVARRFVVFPAVVDFVRSYENRTGNVLNERNGRTTFVVDIDEEDWLRTQRPTASTYDLYDRRAPLVQRVCIGVSERDRSTRIDEEPMAHLTR